MWCCDDNRITPETLASETNISEASMIKTMAGEDGLTYNQLKRIANYFGRGVLFFLEDMPINETKAHSVQFRTIANQKPEISTKLKTFIKRVEKQRDIFIGLKEDFDAAEYPEFVPPILPQNDPYNAARITREWLGITIQKTFEDYRNAIEAKGILVFRSNGYNGKWQIAKETPILGFCLYDENYPVILVRKMAADTSQNFTLMHELAHILLHKSSSIDDESDISIHSKGQEREANAFAGYLLVPDAALDSINDDERPPEVSLYDHWLKPQRNELGVSGEVIIIRLLNAGRLTQTDYNNYRNWRNQREKMNNKDVGGSRGYRHREPKHLFGDNFVRTVLDSLSAKRITLAKASSYLDTLKVQDLHKLEKYYADL